MFEKEALQLSLVLRNTISTYLEDALHCLRTTDLSHCCLAIPVLAVSRLQRQALQLLPISMTLNIELPRIMPVPMHCLDYQKGLWKNRMSEYRG